MTSTVPSQTSPDRTVQWTTTPIIDYEPAPEPLARLPAPVCPTPPAGALRRRSLHPLPRPAAHAREPVPPRSAVVFAETALRQVIEVIDRRRPVAQLRPLMTPALVDRVVARVGAAHRGSATMLKVRVRAVGPVVDADRDEHGKPGDIRAAEVFASFTRSGRVHAVAARIERYRDRWRMVALQIG
ncbi:MAG: Rv3235 family protein [Mycolicibacterium sp.]|uniref:Rv3235 family protein n=1 Tax=Mycolicibacterium sp. TaxID=2320850 RepID=UPI003D0E90E0